MAELHRTRAMAMVAGRERREELAGERREKGSWGGRQRIAE